VPHPDQKILRDIERLEKLTRSNRAFIVECCICRGRGCWWCEHKGFLIYLFKPTYMKRRDFKIIARIDRKNIEKYEKARNMAELMKLLEDKDEN